MFNSPAAPHRFVLQSILGEGDDYHMAYNIDCERNGEVGLLFDTEEGALCFKHAPEFAKIASFVDAPRFD